MFYHTVGYLDFAKFKIQLLPTTKRYLCITYFKPYVTYGEEEYPYIYPRLAQ